MRRYADDSPYTLPILKEDDEDSGLLLSAEQLEQKRLDEAETELVWDKKAQKLHERAKSMDLVHDHHEDDDD